MTVSEMYAKIAEEFPDLMNGKRQRDLVNRLITVAQDMESIRKDYGLTASCVERKVKNYVRMLGE